MEGHLIKSWGISECGRRVKGGEDRKKALVKALGVREKSGKLLYLIK